MLHVCLPKAETRERHKHEKYIKTYTLQTEHHVYGSFSNSLASSALHPPASIARQLYSVAQTEWGEKENIYVKIYLHTFFYFWGLVWLCAAASFGRRATMVFYYIITIKVLKWTLIVSAVERKSSNAVSSMLLFFFVFCNILVLRYLPKFTRGQKNVFCRVIITLSNTMSARWEGWQTHFNSGTALKIFKKHLFGVLGILISFDLQSIASFSFLLILL